MFSQDYIIRMISQAVAVLVQIAGLRQTRQYRPAQQAIDQALESLLGLRADLLKQLDDEVIFRMLTIQDRLDVERVEVMAELFKAEGDILADQDRLTESHQSYLRALSFNLEAALSDQIIPNPTKLAHQVDWLTGFPGIHPIPDDTQWSLFSYYEQTGDYAKAEAALIELANRPGLYADLQPELEAFYQRLLTLPAVEISRTNLDRKKIREKLDKVWK